MSQMSNIDDWQFQTEGRRSQLILYFVRIQILDLKIYKNLYLGNILEEPFRLSEKTPEG